MDTKQSLGVPLATAGRNGGGFAAEVFYVPVTRTGAQHQVLDQRKLVALKCPLINEAKAYSTSSAYQSFLSRPSTNILREDEYYGRNHHALFNKFGLTSARMQERFNPSKQMVSNLCKLNEDDYRGRLRLSFEIPCTIEGGADYFSSGETYPYSDGDVSSGGSPDASSRSGYSSGFESEEDVFFGVFDENDGGDLKRMDFAAPVQKSCVLHNRSYPSRCERITQLLFFHSYYRPPHVRLWSLFAISAFNMLIRNVLVAFLEIYRIGQGILVTTVLALSLAGTVLVVDSCVWKVIRRPLAHNFLTVPFFIAAAASAYFGTICVPFFKRLRIHQVFRIEGPAAHLSKVGTPTMGGLYFVPIGVGVARLVTGFWPKELWGVCMATVAFAAIGFADDCLALWRKHNYGMPSLLKFLLQIFACNGALFEFLALVGTECRLLLVCGLCFGSTMPACNPRIKCVVASLSPGKKLVPLPAPLGLRCIGKWYLPLTTFCFAAMSNGVNLTDGLDGLAAGTSAAAFIGMAVAVLPIYPGLGVFGASMAGACVGFLTQNKYKARVFMGDTGSLALGGGLAAMAACTGMFLPLFISSGVFIVETVSVILQVAFFKLTKRFGGKGRRLLLMAPFHHHLELLGWKEPVIVAAAYAVVYILAMAAALVGLTSA